MLIKQISLVSLFVLITFLSKSQLVTKFNATPLSGCAPFTVNFSDQSTGNPNFWKWDLGNSTVSFLRNPSTIYLNPGIYSVKLVIRNAAGLADSLTKTQYINVYAKPATNFSASPLTGCFPLPVNFTDMSTPGSGTITSWLWDFGDGNTSTQKNPTHTYTASGNYTILLVVTNSNGCSKSFTKSNYISIKDGVNAIFTNSAPSSCSAPQTINFQNQSIGTGTISYQWLFGDGSTSNLANPQHTYTSAGNYSVQLIVTNTTGCTNTVIHTNSIIIGSVNADFSLPTNICAGNSFTINNTSLPTPLGASWDFGDGTKSSAINPVKTYTAAGTYNVTLVSDFGGCQATQTKSLTVTAKPLTGFSASPLTSCSAPLYVNFLNTSTGSVASEWLFGDGSTSTSATPNHNYTTPGNYTVTLISTNSNGCSDTLVKTDYIKIQLPVAIINNLPQQGCAPLAVTFGSTVTSSDPVAGYLWNFGNGITSTQVNPTYTFTPGNYDIQLIITTANGCKDTVFVPQGVKAANKPVANFSATPRDICAKLPVQFSDLSTGLITKWDWNFGDGSHSNLQNPMHNFEDTGLFTITLIVGNNGCFDTLKIPNYIHVKPPIAIFTVVGTCANKYLKIFTDQSIGADSWNWDFGDGTTSTLQNPTHTFTAVGTYTVSLTVVNLSTGCDYIKTLQIRVADEQALFTASALEICRNSSTTFNATSIQGTPAIVSYEWNFGDGSTATVNNVTHTYLQTGLFTVNLKITDVNGCMDSIVKNNYIKVVGPKAAFAPATPGSCLNAAVTFNDLSTAYGSHPLTTWYWNYGDGVYDSLTSAPFQHMYSNSGVYSVTLKIKDSFGCTDTTKLDNALIISTPVANYMSFDTLSCPGKPVIFQSQSTGNSLTYAWTFGDGGTSTLMNPVHVFTADGNYSINLTVTDVYGCTNTKSISQYIIVNTPVANFSVSDSFTTCPPLIMNFTNSSQHVQSYVWDFGDGGGTSSVLSPPHFYSFAGNFSAKLTVTTFGGCTDVKTKQMIVKGPQGSFKYSPILGCTPLKSLFTATTQSRLSFVWDFNDGNTMSTSDSVVSHSYTLPGMYVPKMILTDSGGCNVPINGLDTIKVSGVITSFSADTLIRCNSGNVVFTNTTASNDVITGYQWNFGDGATSTDFNPTHFYSTTGLYYPTLITSTQMGCRDTTTAPVPVRIVRTPVISAAQSPNGCVPLTMNFTGNLLNADTSALKWEWSFSNGNVAKGMQLSPIIYNVGGSYNYSLTVVNSSGCRDTIYNSFEVFSKPIIVAGADISICQGTGQLLSASGAASLTWAPATGLSCINCSSPMATPDSLKDYTVTGTSSQGCVNTDVVRVSVKFPFQMMGGSKDTLCLGQSEILNVSGAATYAWTPTTGLNTATGPTAKATPLVTTNYMVIGKDDKNCFSDTAYFPVKVYPIPTVTAGANKTINVGQTITLTPTFSADVINVKWSPTSWLVSSATPSITVKPNLETQYTVKVSNLGGCSASASVNIYVLCNGANVFIPNTFSPNGDGNNDVFYPRGTGLFTIKQARIFNRWGEEVFARYSFKANDASLGWDGTSKGQKLGVDVYVYMIEIQCDNNSTLVYKGNIALVK